MEVENKITEKLTGGISPQELRRELQEKETKGFAEKACDYRLVAFGNGRDDRRVLVSNRNNKTSARSAD